MADSTHIPTDLRESFARLMDLIPVPFRYEEQIRKDILLFLKLEGEEYVREKIEQSKEVFSEKPKVNSIAMKDG